MSEVVELASALVAEQTLSPLDGSCQSMLNDRLRRNRFTSIDCSRCDTTNSWTSRKFSNEGPTLVFAGHTDVVVPGDLNDWVVDGNLIYPYTLTESDGYLYGRGIADMKGALAAMTIATEELLQEVDPASLKGRLGFIFTSDEEDDRTDGTQVVVKALREFRQPVDYAVVGEASSVDEVGDRIYIARRGSYHLKEMLIQGLAGHVAKENGIDTTEIAVRLQNAAYETDWDGTPDPRFPATSFKTWIIDGGFELENMTSGRTVIRANWRNNPASNGQSIQEKFMAMADEIYDQVAGGQTPSYDRFICTWALSGEPYATPEDAAFVQLVSRAVQSTLGRVPELSGGGGTSDGGVIASLGAEVVELGVQGGSIHMANEHVPVDALESLKDAYKQIMKDVLVTYHVGVTPASYLDNKYS